MTERQTWPSRLEQVVRDFDLAYGVRARAAGWGAERLHRPDEAQLYPTLHIDDVSAIPFLDNVVGVERYQLRARLRAGDGDVVVACCPDLASYEEYNRTYLGLGAPDVLEATPQGPPIEISRACLGPEVFPRLVDRARRAGGMVVHPYMGNEAVWELAARIGEVSGVPVRVLAPPPPVTWFANDKSVLTRLAAELLDDDAVVPSLEGRTEAAIAANLAELARQHRRVALKLVQSASAMGNEVFLSDLLLRGGEAGLRAAVHAFLVEKAWKEGDTVLAVAWMDATSSPSSQLWIPPDGTGPIRIDGFYEQLLVGEEQVFLGSVPAALPGHVIDQMRELSLAVGRAYQRLGYVGRCSFDFIVTEGDVVRFTECNGRWGGTSTPMHLMDRLFPGGRPPYRARDFISEDLVGTSFDDILEACRDLLYDCRRGEGSIVLYNVGCLLEYGKFDVIGMGPTQRDADRMVEETFTARMAAL